MRLNYSAHNGRKTCFKIMVTPESLSNFLRWTWVTNTVTGLVLVYTGHLYWVHQTNYKSIVYITSSGSSHLYRPYTTFVAGTFHQLWKPSYYWYPPLHSESHQAHLTYYLGTKVSRYLARGITTRAPSHIILCDNDTMSILSMRPLILYHQHGQVCHNK